MHNRVYTTHLATSLFQCISHLEYENAKLHIVATIISYSLKVKWPNFQTFSEKITFFSSDIIQKKYSKNVTFKKMINVFLNNVYNSTTHKKSFKFKQM